MNTDVLETTKKAPDELKPIQHPKNIYDSDTGIISYKVPPKNLSPYYQIPNRALAPLNVPVFESPIGSRKLDVCILGAPNAGKSSILNFIIQRNISAVSNKYNTTDEAKIGFFTDYDSKTQL